MSGDLALPDDEQLPLIWKFAQRVAATEFVPQTFRNRPDAVLAAIQYGRELGIGPMQSLQSIHVIQGKPSLAPEAMRSRVFAAGHTIETLAYTNERVSLKGTRADTGATAEVEWTLEDAQRAKLTNKDSWKTYPRAMLLARATAELCRLLFPDVIAGASYTPEELGDTQFTPDVIDVDEVRPEAEAENPPAVNSTGDTGPEEAAADSALAVAASSSDDKTAPATPEKVAALQQRLDEMNEKARRPKPRNPAEAER